MTNLALLYLARVADDALAKLRLRFPRLPWRP